MRELTLTEMEAASLRRAINIGIKQQLKGLASARYRVKAALDLGATPDTRDAGGVEFCTAELANLRAVKDMLLDGEEEYKP